MKIFDRSSVQAVDSGDSCQAGQQCPATGKYSFTIQLDVYKCLEIVNVAGKLNFVMQSNMKTWWQTTNTYFSQAQKTRMKFEGESYTCRTHCG